jgi:hypothetical protein
MEEGDILTAILKAIFGMNGYKFPEGEGDYKSC